MTSQSWECPFCRSHQVITDENFQVVSVGVDIGKTEYGQGAALKISGIRCANPECNQVTLSASLYGAARTSYGDIVPVGDVVDSWVLRPGSFAKPQPKYIPAPLLADYYEACAICNSSAKASATLSRRCLQGMIRDFCKIPRNRLVDEIAELRKLVDEGNAPPGVQAETLDAIDHIREVGNIGAHMEKDINIIVDVDPGEAQALIELIEMLFDEWYVARHVRQTRLAAIAKIAEAKKEQRNGNNPVALVSGEAGEEPRE